MSDRALTLDQQGSPIDPVETAYRRVAERKLRERGCPEAEITARMERLLANRIEITLGAPLKA